MTLALGCPAMLLYEMRDVPERERLLNWTIFGIGVVAGGLVSAIAVTLWSRSHLKGFRLGGNARPKSRTLTAALWGAGIAGLLLLGPSQVLAAVLGAFCGFSILVAVAPRWVLKRDNDGVPS